MEPGRCLPACAYKLWLVCGQAINCGTESVMQVRLAVLIGHPKAPQWPQVRGIGSGPCMAEPGRYWRQWGRLRCRKGTFSFTVRLRRNRRTALR
jgi:hypothetical protein